MLMRFVSLEKTLYKGILSIIYLLYCTCVKMDPCHFFFNIHRRLYPIIKYSLHKLLIANMHPWLTLNRNARHLPPCHSLAWWIKPSGWGTAPPPWFHLIPLFELGCWHCPRCDRGTVWRGTGGNIGWKGLALGGGVLSVPDFDFNLGPRRHSSGWSIGTFRPSGFINVLHL